MTAAREGKLRVKAMTHCDGARCRHVVVRRLLSVTQHFVARVDTTTTTTRHLASAPLTAALEVTSGLVHST